MHINTSCRVKRLFSWMAYQISSGDTLARIPQESGGTKDITGECYAPHSSALFQLRSYRQSRIVSSIKLQKEASLALPAWPRLLRDDPIKRQLNVFSERVERGDSSSIGRHRTTFCVTSGVHAVTRYIDGNPGTCFVCRALRLT